jgi:hypothetical protein
MAWFTHQDLVALAERRSFELTAQVWCGAIEIWVVFERST